MDRVDLYSEIHKAQRLALFDLVSRAGSIAPDDETATADLVVSVTSMIEELTRHATAEEEIVHPLLAVRDLRVLNKLHDAHVRIEGYLGRVADDAAALERGDSPDALQDLYRSLSRFTAGYLFHIANEEDEGMPVLQAAYSDEQLSLTLSEFLRAHLHAMVLA